MEKRHRFVKQQFLPGSTRRMAHVARAVVMGGLLALLGGAAAHAQTVAGIDYSDRADADNTYDMSEADVFGQRFPSEHLVLTDEVTGVDITALTTSRHEESKFYQTHPQWTADGEYIVFRSDRTGDWLTHAISMEDKEIVQVTTADRGGRELHLGWTENVLYYFRDGELIRMDLGTLLQDSEQGTVTEQDDYEEVIATLPEGVRPTGGAGLDADEERMFIASRAGEGQSAIYSIDFESGELTKLQEVPFRANHLQANPWVSGEVMYSWETGGDAPQRIWQLRVDEEGNVENLPVYEEHPDEWVTHEVFMDADHILFNVMGHIQRLQEQPTGIVSHNTRTGESELHDQIGGGGYWHSAGTQDLQWAVGDGFNGDLYRINLETGERTLLTTGHRLNSRSPFTGEAHSHHSISPDGQWVLFNSSLLTEGDLMLVPLHPEGL